NTLPSQIHLPTLPQGPLKSIKKPQSLLLDFGKETFGFIKLHGLEGKGNVGIYYGESQEEAQAIESCETLDRLQIDLIKKKDSVMDLSKAFRYVNIQFDPGISIDSVSMLYEFSPVTERGKFR